MITFCTWVNTTFPLGLTKEKAQFETRTVDENAQFLIGKIKEAYERKSSHEEPTAVKSLERYIILNAIDRLWQEHLYAMDALREGVYLRSYAQKDPLVEYKTEAYDMFVELMSNIKNEVLHNLFRSTSNLQAFENFLASLPAIPSPRTSPGPAPGPRLRSALSSPSPSAPWPWPATAMERGRSPSICRSGVPFPKWGGTSRVPAAAGRNTKTAAAALPDESGGTSSSRPTLSSSRVESESGAAIEANRLVTTSLCDVPARPTGPWLH